jgi:hypothetical protein
MSPFACPIALATPRGVCLRKLAVTLGGSFLGTRVLQALTEPSAIMPLKTTSTSLRLFMPTDSAVRVPRMNLRYFRFELKKRTVTLGKGI